MKEAIEFRQMMTQLILTVVQDLMMQLRIGHGLGSLCLNKAKKIWYCNLRFLFTGKICIVRIPIVFISL